MHFSTPIIVSIVCTLIKYGFILSEKNIEISFFYYDQLTFGTAYPNQQFDISFDNTTTVHIQGLILRKSGLFYVANNGEHPFRVNDALLHSNEASPLGTRAVIKVNFDFI